MVAVNEALPERARARTDWKAGAETQRRRTRWLLGDAVALAGSLGLLPPLVVFDEVVSSIIESAMRRKRQAKARAR